MTRKLSISFDERLFVKQLTCQAHDQRRDNAMFDARDLAESASVIDGRTTL